MQVQSSTINLHSQHVMRRSEQQRSISIEENSAQPPTASRRLTAEQTRPGFTRPITSTFGSRGNSQITIPNANTITGNSANNRPIHYSATALSNDPQQIATSSSLDSHLILRKTLIEYLTGITFNTVSVETSTKAQTEATDHPILSAPYDGNNVTSSQVFTFHGTLISEYEMSSVTIEGKLVDHQGTQIEINLSVAMERSYRETEADLRIRANAQLRDPLVINFNDEAVALSNQRISFDINSDGIDEQIPTFQSNSAYIALDKNGDGLINNGSELFGAQSGNGFVDLAEYDEDGNGFIDRADTVYTHLQAFDPGTGSLRPLHLIGVGALALDSTHSPFSLTDDNNSKLGQVRSTGFYVNNNGSAGTLQQIDIVV